MVVAFVAYKAAVIASTIANLGLDAAMLPQIVTIGAIVIAIGALIAIAILVVKHWDDLTAAVSGAFDKVKQAAVTVIDWIKTNWPLLLAIITGPFGLAVLEIQKHWDAITGAARTAVNTIKGAFSSVAGAVGGALSGAAGAAGGILGSIGGKILGGLSSVAGWGKKIGEALRGGMMGAMQGIGGVLEAIFKGAINAVLSVWNDLKIPGVKLPGPLPDLPSINLPNIPLLKMAKGGLVTGPTRALLGEAGPELVVPLSGGGIPISVRVFIGDTELRGLVRSEVVESNTRVARSLLAGAR
jgi:phage-related protein